MQRLKGLLDLISVARLISNGLVFIKVNNIIVVQDQKLMPLYSLYYSELITTYASDFVPPHLTTKQAVSIITVYRIYNNIINVVKSFI